MDNDRGCATEASDRTLLRRFRAGEHDAATQLYVRYAARLQALARAQTSPRLSSRFDPDDVVQSVFRTFFRRAAAGLYDVPAGEELWQLLLVLALNKVRALATYHRAQKRDVGRTAGSPGLAACPGIRDETPLRILTWVIDEVIGDLPLSQRPVIEMWIEGYEVAEIARATGRSKRTVERLLQTFRGRLAELIDDPDESCRSGDV